MHPWARALAVLVFAAIPACAPEPVTPSATLPAQKRVDPPKSTTAANPKGFALDADDLHLSIDFPLAEMCIAASLWPVPGRPCDDIPKEDARQFFDSGGLLMVLARNPTGTLVFIASVQRGMYAITHVDAYEAGLMESAAKAPGIKLIKDTTRSAAVVLPDGSPLVRSTFDTGPERQAMEDLDTSHWASLAVGGRSGLYSLTWLSNRKRAPEVDASLEHAVKSIVHRDDDAPVLPESNERAIASFQPRITACYRQALAKFPAMVGTLEVTIDIRPDGRVESVRKTAGDGLSASLDECILALFRPVRFRAPGGAGAKLSFPLTLKT
jgi:hypothetical protein